MRPTCAVPFCDEWVTADLKDSDVKICNTHAWQVAMRYREAILAREEIERRKRSERLDSQELERQGNPKGESLVYYVRIGGYIKIGFSARLKNRLVSLRADSLLAVEPGGPELERERHREFAAERIDLRRENFRPSERLEAHIAHLRAEHSLPTWALLPRTSEVSRRHLEDS